MLIRPKNWEEFQHYKDRDPLWIKLHKKLLDDYEFQSLPVESRALAPMLWLLASEDKTGLINAEDRKLAFRLRTTPAALEDAIRPLIASGFFIPVHDAINPLAVPERPASPQVQTQVENKKEEVLPVGTGQSVSKPPSKPKGDYTPGFEQFWKAYPTDPNMSKKDAFAVWKKLSTDKRVAAIAGVPGFKRYCDENKAWYRPVYADRFLSKEKFEGFGADVGSATIHVLSDEVQAREQENLKKFGVI